jgi:fatty-acid desaturase
MLLDTGLSLALEPVPMRTRARVRTFSVRQAVILGATHAAAILALFVPSRAAGVALVVAYAMTGYGISLGYHRGLSHGAFRAPSWLTRALALLGTLAFQGGPITWVGFHRAHHRFTDQPGDPHAATRGFLWSHVGWALHKGPNGYRRQKMRGLTRSLERDAVLVWLERNHLAINLVAFALVALAFGGAVALWTFPLRIVLLWHVTWLTNSLAHDAHSDDPAPRNVRWLAWIGFGEGLHANHHDRPSAACFAHKPGELDPGFWPLALLARARLVHVPRRHVTVPFASIHEEAV